MSYREITVGAGLMEPIGEGRPLLSVQDLESRLVFTKCKVSAKKFKLKYLLETFDGFVLLMGFGELYKIL